MNKIIIITLLTAFISANAEDNNASVMIESLMLGTMDNKIEVYQKYCTDKMKAAVSAENLNAVHNNFKNWMVKGQFNYSFLTKLNKKNCVIYVYKIETDKAEDFIAEMVVENGKVNGFWVK